MLVVVDSRIEGQVAVAPSPLDFCDLTFSFFDDGLGVGLSSRVFDFSLSR